MSKNTNTITNTSPIELISEELKKFTDTSKKIRYLSSLGMDTKTIYKTINLCGVTTKTGGEIRYQHVRNVLHTILSSK